MLNTKMINLRNYYVVSFVLSLLVGCISSPIERQHTPPTQPKVVGPTTPENSNTPNVNSYPSPESKTETKPTPGGYYLDDGPGDNAPANIDDIPNPVLKSEQPYERANKPYSALGQQFTPMTKYVPYKKQGIASWYGKRFHGKKTSTGEIYDMYAMTAAHTILPIPSFAKVTNPVNGRSVIVRINDRGPFKRDRLIDLSYAAAFQLRLIKQGSGLVEVETIDTSPEALKKISNNNSPASIAENTTSKPDVVAIDNTASSLSKASTNNPSTQYYVQVGAFKNESNGNFLIKKIQGLNLVENVDVANVYNNGLYRVKLGPYSSRNEADIAAANIRSQLNTAAHVTN